MDKLAAALENEEVLHVQDSVELMKDDVLLGVGQLVLTQERIFWAKEATSAECEAALHSYNFADVIMHASKPPAKGMMASAIVCQMEEPTAPSSSSCTPQIHFESEEPGLENSNPTLAVTTFDLLFTPPQDTNIDDLFNHFCTGVSFTSENTGADERDFFFNTAAQLEGMQDANALKRQLESWEDKLVVDDDNQLEGAEPAEPPAKIHANPSEEEPNTENNAPVTTSTTTKTV
eukprot:TRINITY_DN61470_c0_g2_i1.p1 TRINITY_DN61470_c0_g2~~TRINITY_DN61470_c0_g2_i1.p1  ORF type:complete len:241 (+),score=45.85 TRINITY_DN61470_c0_g2_i1:25-723(+)